MAPPKPPPSTHQTSAAAVSKRRHRSRHDPQHPQLSVEPPSPAKMGRGGLSESASATAGNSPTADPTAHGGVGGPEDDAAAPSHRHVAAGTQQFRSGRPTLAAGAAVSLPAGKICSTVERSGTVQPQAPRPMHLRESVVGVKDHPRMAGDGEMGAGLATSCGLNIARNLSRSAPKMFDTLPQRAPGLSSVIEVPLEAGEVWERCPESVTRDGSTVRAVFSSSPIVEQQVASGVVGSGVALLSNTNGVNTQCPGKMREPRMELDALNGGAGGSGTAPDLTGRATGQLGTCSLSAQSGGPAASCQLQGVGFGSSGGLTSHGRGLWQADMHPYTPGGALGVGGAGGLSSDAAKVAQIWTDSALSAPDFAHIERATDFDSSNQHSREQGGMQDGNMGFTSSVVPGSMAPSMRNATSPKVATQFIAPTRQTAPGEHFSAWGCSPEPWGTGNCSPEYREAFPTIRGEDDAIEADHMLKEWGGAPREEDPATSKRKVSGAELQKKIMDLSIQAMKNEVLIQVSCPLESHPVSKVIQAFQELHISVSEPKALGMTMQFSTYLW